MYPSLIRYLLNRSWFLQVSLRDPMRSGADDDTLKDIIGAAVCISKC